MVSLQRSGLRAGGNPRVSISLIYPECSSIFIFTPTPTVVVVIVVVIIVEHVADRVLRRLPCCLWMI
jgi:hypothetical protein